jgi:hypothetical protein
VSITVTASASEAYKRMAYALNCLKEQVVSDNRTLEGLPWISLVNGGSSRMMDGRHHNEPGPPPPINHNKYSSSSHHGGRSSYISSSAADAHPPPNSSSSSRHHHRAPPPPAPYDYEPASPVVSSLSHSVSRTLAPNHFTLALLLYYTTSTVEVTTTR